MEIEVLGKTIKGRTQKTISKKLNISEQQLKNFEENKDQIIYNNKTGQALKVFIGEEDAKPLLEDYFNVKRVPRKVIATNTKATLKKDIVVHGKGVPYGKKFNGTVYATFVLKHPSTENGWNAKVSFDIDEVINSWRHILEKAKMNLVAFHGNDLLEEFGFYEEFDNFDKGINVELKFLSLGTNDMEFTTMRLRDSKPLDITTLFGNVVKFTSKNGKCLIDYLKSKYSKISPKTIDKYDNNGMTPEELYMFCEKYGINMKLYNFEGKCIKEYTPEERNKNYGGLYGIAYNNHFYPLTNNKIEKINTIKKTCKYIYNKEYEGNALEQLKHFVSYQTYMGKMYESIYVKDTRIINVQYDGVLYHANEDWEEVSKITKILGLESNISESLKLTSLAPIIEDLFLKSDIKSFYPYNEYNRAYNFFNKDLNGDFITVDHCKHYMDSLRNLKYLIKVDIKSAKFIDKPTVLIDGYLYIAKPKKLNYLMPSTKKYDVEFLRYCKNEGIEFDLLEAVEYEKVENYYNVMIKELSKKLSESSFKKIMCYTIGNMGKTPTLYKDEILKFVKIANKEETACTGGYTEPLNEDFNMIYERKEINNINIFNKLPIHNQVLDNSRIAIYEMMKKLGLQSNEIKQIRTDAITFLKNEKRENIIKKEVEKLNKDWTKNIGLWKEVKDVIYFKNELEHFDNEEVSFKLDNITKIHNNQIYIDYAGSGKTYHIINKLIPTLKGDYIVLTPSHSSLREYKTKNLNCKVIQFFEFNPKEIPEYKNIIIDEIGMCSSHACALISKWALLGKRIFGFGDFKQLTPVNSKVQNGEIYLNWVFNDITKLGTNYRNDFTYDFYDSLINCNDVKKSTDVVKKYNTDFYKADAIICYKNTTRQKYNNLILKKIGLKHGDKGEMVQCKTNKLASKNIFNNFIFKVINNIGDDVILSDDYDNYTITQKDFFDYFEPAYCRTIYNIQGESIKSIHYCMDDIQFLKGNVLYTVISRIKNK